MAQLATEDPSLYGTHCPACHEPHNPKDMSYTTEEYKRVFRTENDASSLRYCRGCQRHFQRVRCHNPKCGAIHRSWDGKLDPFQIGNATFNPGKLWCREVCRSEYISAMLCSYRGVSTRDPKWDEVISKPLNIQPNDKCFMCHKGTGSFLFPHQTIRMSYGVMHRTQEGKRDRQDSRVYCSRICKLRSRNADSRRAMTVTSTPPAQVSTNQEEETDTLSISDTSSCFSSGEENGYETAAVAPSVGPQRSPMMLGQFPPPLLSPTPTIRWVVAPPSQPPQPIWLPMTAPNGEVVMVPHFPMPPMMHHPQTTPMQPSVYGPPPQLSLPFPPAQLFADPTAVFTPVSHLVIPHAPPPTPVTPAQSNPPLPPPPHPAVSISKFELPKPALNEDLLKVQKARSLVGSASDVNAEWPDLKEAKHLDKLKSVFRPLPSIHAVKAAVNAANASAASTAAAAAAAAATPISIEQALFPRRVSHVIPDSPTASIH